MKIHTIIEGKLYQSPRMHGLSKMQKEQAVRLLKITDIVNLWHLKDDELAQIPGVTYIHHYIPDGKAIDPELQTLAKVLCEKMKSGSVILTQCYGGRNRSGLLSALIAKEYFGCSGERALEFVRSVRPKSLVNENFAAFLRGLQ